MDPADNPQNKDQTLPAEPSSNPPVPPEVDIEALKQQSQTPIDVITNNAGAGIQDHFLDPIPLGDTPAGPTQGQETPPTDNFGVQSQQLLDEIDAVEPDEGISDAALGGFKGLKSKYKNKITALQSQYEEIENKYKEAESRLNDLSPLETEVGDLRTQVEQAQALQSQLEELDKRNKELSIYEKKYNLLGNPEVKAQITDPMSEYKGKAMEIIQGALGSHIDAIDVPREAERLWDKLRTSNNDFDTNTMISEAGITDLNAMSLKSAVNQFRGLDAKLSELSNPEFIDAAIAHMNGQAQTRSDAKATSVFGAVQKQFEDHIQEIKESEVNKEHNHFVYEKTIEDATKTFETFRKVLSSEYGNDEAVLSYFAKAAFTDAAYRSQSIMNKFLLKELSERDKVIKELKAPVDVRQTSESPKAPTQDNSLNSLKDQTSTSLDDIVRGVGASFGN